MGSKQSRTKDSNPSPTGGTYGDIRSPGAVEPELHSAARSSFASRSPIEPPVIAGPLGPASTTKAGAPLEHLHRSLSQPDVLEAEHQETLSQREEISATFSHNPRASHGSSNKDTDVDILPSLTNPTEHSEDLQYLDECLSVNQIEEHHRLRGQSDARFTSDELVEQLEDVSAKRLQVREMRVALRYKREEETNYRLALMKRLNSLIAQDPPLNIGSITNDVERLQSATEAYLGLERRYHEKESELGQDEYLLIQSIERFSKRLRHPSSSMQGESEGAQHSTPGDDNHSIQSVPSRFPPAVADYLSRVGDARILQERLLDLDSQWYDIVDKQKIRLSLDIPMDDESLAFLRSYDASKLEIQKEFNETMLDIVHLRAICEEQGLLTEEYIGRLDYLHENGLEEISVQFEDPLKTSEVDDSSPFYEPGSAKLSSAMFINKWILHKLRHSSVEISRLKSAPEIRRLSQQGWNEANISRLALTVWFSDDTVRSPPQAPSEDDYNYTRIPDNSRTVDHSHDSQKMTGLPLPDIRSEPDMTPKKEDPMTAHLRALSL
ncbi:uncharacterized protein ACLA_073610 [Aspergillus clavatus NRRL 1]|uniref:Uncharacterized protein n=1 Tax=Aspergillus clavatus (strain ATCC 1007 / CBS 513.65 / DSM 816 / NCTC 3887 / NRRL 1 / QM 1276 / 107) TaxID=344612 RepID=A1C7F5_ASPCL|nr:uncharacterized protein ACLA_073610 [Aspergillus clavatus NRRL 1]EAW14326.1 conserved hypothetical protein [Aspergillus clavatus NRRL 1]